MKKIAVFTGTRAEYGLLFQLIKTLHEDEGAILQLIVGGMHLAPEFGYTVTEIEKDGFPIAERIDLLLSSGSAVGTAKSMGLALISASECLERLSPDLLVILGDRTESFAIAQAAMVSRIPIAHIHGGETTEGAIDEAIRHSLTKMAHLHFTTTEEYRKRVIQLGEQPDRVFNVGAPGVDNIVTLELLSRDELQSNFPFSLSSKYILMTYHPVTLLADGGLSELRNLLAVIEEYPELQVIVTYPNSDSKSHDIIKLLKKFHEKNASRVGVAQSLGQVRYLSVLKYCQAVVGNSSSGIIEAPSLGVPTINIGDRQKGRVCSESVLHSDGSVKSIRSCFHQIADNNFQNKCRIVQNPYGQGGASESIAKILLSTPLDTILKKTFYDI